MNRLTCALILLLAACGDDQYRCLRSHVAEFQYIQPIKIGNTVTYLPMTSRRTVCTSKVWRP